MAIMKKQNGEALHIAPIAFGEADFYLLGISPFVCNRLSNKARHELLLPAPTKNRAERAAVLKHDPIQEYRSSPYRYKDDTHLTRLKHPADAFKKAIAKAALDIPGAAKSEIGRLVRAQWQDVELFGVPQLYMAIVRQAGMTKTPDVRTRAIIPQWACKVTISYMQPKLNLQAVANLFGASGLIVGVGDGRPEKGSLSFGQYQIVQKDNEAWNAVVAQGGRDAQDAALENPTEYDEETSELYSWFNSELTRRGGREGLRIVPPDTEEEEVAEAAE